MINLYTASKTADTHSKNTRGQSKGESEFILKKRTYNTLKQCRFTVKMNAIFSPTAIWYDRIPLWWAVYPTSSMSVKPLHLTDSTFGEVCDIQELRQCKYNNQAKQNKTLLTPGNSNNKSSANIITKDQFGIGYGANSISNQTKKKKRRVQSPGKLHQTTHRPKLCLLQVASNQLWRHHCTLWRQ